MKSSSDITLRRVTGGRQAFGEAAFWASLALPLIAIPHLNITGALTGLAMTLLVALLLLSLAVALLLWKFRLARVVMRSLCITLYVLFTAMMIAVFFVPAVQATMGSWLEGAKRTLLYIGQMLLLCLLPAQTAAARRRLRIDTRLATLAGWLLVLVAAVSMGHIGITLSWLPETVSGIPIIDTVPLSNWYEKLYLALCVAIAMFTLFAYPFGKKHIVAENVKKITIH